MSTAFKDICVNAARSETPTELNLPRSLNRGGTSSDCVYDRAPVCECCVSENGMSHLGFVVAPLPYQFKVMDLLVAWAQVEGIPYSFFSFLSVFISGD